MLDTTAEIGDTNKRQVFVWESPKECCVNSNE